MRSSRLDRWLATTALLLVTTVGTLPVQAAPERDPEFTAVVSVPVPPPAAAPTVNDLGPPVAAAPPAAAAPINPANAPAIAAPAVTAPATAKSPAAAMPPAAAASPPPSSTPPATAVMTPASATPPAPVQAAVPPKPTAPFTPVAAPATETPAATPAVAPAAEPAAPPPAPAVMAAPAELAPVAEKVRDLLNAKADRWFDRKAKQSVEAFYSARGYEPIWSDNGAESARAIAATKFFAGVDSDGLDPSDYSVPSFANTDPASLAEAELKFTATALTFARHAQIGRIHYSRVSNDILYELAMPEPAEILGRLSGAADVATALAGFYPPHAEYKALKAKLAEIRGGGSSEGSSTRIAAGPQLRVGMKDGRVPKLRERLDVNGDPDDLTYDKTLAEAVKSFQRQHSLQDSGNLTTATIEKLNGPRHDRDVDLIIVNMERWRWLPRDLGKAYVMVNIPNFTLKVMDQGKMVWTTRIVSGAPGEKATPLLTETMKYITVNPTWNVPPSIIHNEYLPALSRDPTVLDRMGLRMEHNRDGSVHIWQPPGAGNALGRIRFNFPNKFLVYQHDTPDKYMFAHERRAYSHGCMRVQFPDQYAEALLNISNPADGYTADKIRRMYGTGERDIHLNTPIPVHLTYQTAFVDDAGHLVTREDIYGRDARMFALIKGDERRMADVPVERREASNGGGGGAANAARRQASRYPQGQTSFFGMFFR